ncbi:hypothetical protein [Myxococcus qinghaiensis]|uniref:hypothetical protein n=1 Tax=Myxococcus qinghaiensis TaxID=2906758 RepID=UPI0020A7D4DA|nr:hypothetical protein [Myxococcus qinghaiensis]MCP3166227.1 hypothetical protein [Myxococcus qinghaiensis]
MKHLLLPLLLLLVSSCVRHAGARTANPPGDPSIQFPDTPGQDAISLAAEGQPYVLDGAMLGALSIAANDLLPLESRERSCWNRQESYLYRVLRQGDVFFVSISANPTACGAEPRMLDGGAAYAVGMDGRILRRRFDGEPETLVPGGSTPDAGTESDAGTSADAGIPVGDTTWGKPLQPVPSWWTDGGTDAGAAPR